jgi:hypothetical protein
MLRYDQLWAEKLVQEYSDVVSDETKGMETKAIVEHVLDKLCI